MAESQTPRHEPDNVSVTTIAWIGLGLLAMALISVFGVTLAFNRFAPKPTVLDAETQWKRQKTSPGVEPHQAYSREQIQADEQRLLSQYGWQDHQQGIVRIPIERAMELMAERKLQVDWPKKDEVNP